jgi:prepilin-type processing-associated H-X9-DG protein
LGNAATDPNEWAIKNGVLFPYLKSVGVYHCPADASKVNYFPKFVRKRSVSMSFYMNGQTNLIYTHKSKTSDLRAPAEAFVFLDESALTINDGVFFLHTPGDPGERWSAREYEAICGSPSEFHGAHWMDLPSDRHNLGCNLSFADGHAEHRKWRSPKNGSGDQYTTDASDYEDLRWLQDRIPK